MIETKSKKIICMVISFCMFMLMTTRVMALDALIPTATVTVPATTIPTIATATPTPTVPATATATATITIPTNTVTPTINSTATVTAKSTSSPNTSSSYQTESLPKTGTNSFIIGLVVVGFGISAIYAYIKIRDYKEM